MRAIITTGTGYGDKELLTFFRSAGVFCGDAKIFLLCHKEDRARLPCILGESKNVELVYVRKKIDRVVVRFANLVPVLRFFARCGFAQSIPVMHFVGTYSLHIALERYFVARDLLRSLRLRGFTSAMFTDSRDVVFQGDPFCWSAELYSGLEARTLGNCPFNSAWVNTLYGEDGLQFLTKEAICCSGVTIGHVDAMINYLSLMASEAWRVLPKLIGAAGYDQAIHNWLIRSGKVSVSLTDNREGKIATLGYEDINHFGIDCESGLIRVQGHIPAVLHQFDRYKFLVEHIQQQYGVDSLK